MYIIYNVYNVYNNNNIILSSRFVVGNDILNIQYVVIGRVLQEILIEISPSNLGLRYVFVD